MQTSTDSRSASAIAAATARCAAASRTVGAMMKSGSPSARPAGPCTALPPGATAGAGDPSLPSGRVVMSRAPSTRVVSAEVAARHRKGHPGDVGGLVGGEEKDGRDLLLDRPVALHQRRLDGLVHDRLVPGLLLVGLGSRATGHAAFGRFGATGGCGHHADAVPGV